MKRRESQALLEQIRKRGSRGSGTMTGTDTNASSVVIEDDGGGGGGDDDGGMEGGGGGMGNLSVESDSVVIGNGGSIDC